MDATFFPARLRELREGAGLTQQVLADRAGVSLRAVSQWERGVREPGWSNVVALASALGVTCLAFLERPTVVTEARRGRPRKPAEVSETQAKRPRGRPRKRV